MTDHSHSDRERASIARRRASSESAPGADSPAAHPLLTLQRQVGNAQIARLLAQRDALPEEELQAKHDAAQRQEEDEEEQEELAQAMHDPASGPVQRHGSEEELQAKHDLAQREGEAEEEEQEDQQIHAKHDQAQRDALPEDEMLQGSPEVGLEGGPVSDSVASRIEASRGQGAPLDSGTRDSMESAFGTSFEGVRVHTDQESSALNNSISAKAFTTGNDIYLRQDTSPSDQSLMAHELTHVVQQRSMSGSGGMQVGPAGDSYEQEADAVAAAVTSGQSVAPQRKTEETSE